MDSLWATEFLFPGYITKAGQLLWLLRLFTVITPKPSDLGGNCFAATPKRSKKPTWNLHFENHYYEMKKEIQYYLFFFFLMKQSEDPTKMYLVTNHECIAARFCTYRKHGRPDSWGSHFYQQTRDGWLVWSSSDDTSVSVTSFPPTHPSLCQ